MTQPNGDGVFGPSVGGWRPRRISSDDVAFIHRRDGHDPSREAGQALHPLEYPEATRPPGGRPGPPGGDRLGAAAVDPGGPRRHLLADQAGKESNDGQGRQVGPRRGGARAAPGSVFRVRRVRAVGPTPGGRLLLDGPEERPSVCGRTITRRVGCGSFTPATRWATTSRRAWCGSARPSRTRWWRSAPAGRPARPGRRSP
jgi:hypothetical protein